MINREYPSTRLRRLRQSKTIRDLVAENTVSSNDLIEPMFLVNSKSDAGPVNSMPGVERFEKDQLFREIEEKEAGMLKFVREVDSSKKLYESFLQRVKETNEAQNLQVSKLKVIETPNLPSSPFSPQPAKNFILAFTFKGFFNI